MLGHCRRGMKRLIVRKPPGSLAFAETRRCVLPFGTCDPRRIGLLLAAQLVVSAADQSEVGRPKPELLPCPQPLIHSV